MRVITFLSASVLAFACGTQDTPDDEATNQEVGACVTITGADIGQRVTVLVPSIDATMPVTFTSWVPKGDDPNAYIAFSLDAIATFKVKAGDNTFEGAGTAWRNPNGTAGDVRGIESVEICGARADENPPPAAEDGSGGDGGGSGSDGDQNCHGFC